MTEYTKKWLVQAFKLRDLNTAAKQLEDAYNEKVKAYKDAHPDNSSPLDLTPVEAQNKDLYDKWIDKRREASDFSWQLNRAMSPQTLFVQRLYQCQNLSAHNSPQNFIPKDAREMVKKLDVGFTETLLMMKTDNGWQQVR